jgi:hypothetical protein
MREIILFPPLFRPIRASSGSIAASYKARATGSAAGRMAKPIASLDEKIFHTTKFWHQFSNIVAGSENAIHMH